MTTHVIPIAQAKASKLSAPNPPKACKSKEGNHNYTRLYLKYNYGNDTMVKLGSPIFELKKTDARVKKSIVDNNKEIWKLNLFVNDEQDLNGCSELDNGILSCMFKYEKPYLINSTVVPSDFRAIAFRPHNEEGDVMEGATPIISLKMDFGTTFVRVRVKFDENGEIIKDARTGLPKIFEEPINYHDLDGMAFEAAVTICVRDLYQGKRGTTPSPSLYVRTCWILSNPSPTGYVKIEQSTVINDMLLNTSPEDLRAFADETSIVRNVLTDMNESEDEDEIGDEMIVFENKANNVQLMPPSSTEETIDLSRSAVYSQGHQGYPPTQQMMPNSGQMYSMNNYNARANPINSIGKI